MIVRLLGSNVSFKSSSRRLLVKRGRPIEGRVSFVVSSESLSYVAKYKNKSFSSGVWIEFSQATADFLVDSSIIVIGGSIL